MNYNKSLFEGTPKMRPNMSRFNLSHEYKSIMDVGRLTPVLTLEVFPQDEFTINSEFMFRFQPLYFPIMHKLTMRADYFYIPNRILWPRTGPENLGWEKWIAEMEEYEHPVVDADMEFNGGGTSTQVLSYMGIPLLGESASNKIITGLNAFPLSAYLKIWDEYYRVPQLEDERWFPLQPGDNTAAFGTAFGDVNPDQYHCFYSKWEKDYLTSCLPTPQIGEAVQVPLISDELPIGQTVRDSTTGLPASGISLNTGNSGELTDGNDPMYLDIQESASIIKQLRIAEVLQSYYERIMKVGQRYRDFILGMWGNDPQPGVIDRPVLFGSKFGRVQIADVMTQAETLTPPNYDYTHRTGDYRGQANLYQQDNDELKYTCMEHGWIICILQVNPNTSYGGGIQRFWRRSIQTDYPLAMFSSIGDQEVLKEEVRYRPDSSTEANRGTFGYNPRHSEARYQNNIHTSHLEFNELISTHMGRVWNDNLDTEIDSNFVTTVPAPTEGGLRLSDVFRILPLSTDSGSSAQATMFTHIFHSIYVYRALPLYATPNL